MSADNHEGSGISSELLSAAKLRMNITWDDSDTDNRLEQILADLIPEIRRVIAVDEKFEFKAGEERRLLLSAVFYEWNNSLDEFWKNYASDIHRIRLKHEVGDYDAKQNQDGV